MKMNTSNDGESVYSKIYNIGHRAWKSVSATAETAALTLTAAAMLYFGGCDAGKASKVELDNVPGQIQTMVEKVEKSNKTLEDDLKKSVGEDLAKAAEDNKKQDEAITDLGGKAAENAKGIAGLGDDLKKTNAAVEEANKTAGTAKKTADEASTEVKKVKDDVKGIEDKIADPLVGRRIEIGDYALTIKNAEGGIVRYSLSKGTAPFQIIDFKKYASGAAFIGVDFDADSNGKIEPSERTAGIYTPSNAKLESAKLENLVLEFNKKKKAADEKKAPLSDAEKAEIEAVAKQFSGIGKAPSYSISDASIIEIFDIFNAAGASGKHTGGKKVDAPAASFGGKHILSIEKVADMKYKIFSWDSAVAEISFDSTGKFDITDYTGAAASSKSHVLPKDFLADLVTLWEAGNERGKDSYISEQKRQLDEKNSDSRKKELSEDYDRGFKAKISADGNGSLSTEAIVSAGTGSANMKLHGKHSASASENSNEKLKSIESLGEITIEYRLGKESEGPSANHRPKITLSLFGQHSSAESSLFGKDPITSTDGSGRFETVEEYLGGNSEQSKGFGSLSLKGTLSSGDFANLSLFGGYGLDRLKENTRISITDLTGIIPEPIVNDIVTSVRARNSLFGAEFLGGVKIGESTFMPTFSYTGGKISISDHINPGQEINYSEMDIGMFANLSFSDKMKLTAGGKWSMADIEGEKVNGGNFVLGSTFGLGDHCVISPVGRITVSEGDKPRYSGNLVVVAGGSGNSRKNVQAVDAYQLNSILMDNSHQYTPEMIESKNKWAWSNLIRNLDANMALGMVVDEAYDADGNKTVVGGGNIVFMGEAYKDIFNNPGKVFIDAFFNKTADGYNTGIGIGASSKSAYSRIGYKQSSDDMTMGNKDDKHNLEFELGFNF